MRLIGEGARAVGDTVLATFDRGAGRADSALDAPQTPIPLASGRSERSLRSTSRASTARHARVPTSVVWPTPPTASVPWDAAARQQHRTGIREATVSES